MALLKRVKTTEEVNKPYTVSVSDITREVEGYILIPFPLNQELERSELKKISASQCGVPEISQHDVSDKHCSQASHYKSNRGRLVILYILCSKQMFYFPA